MLTWYTITVYIINIESNNALTKKGYKMGRKTRLVTWIKKALHDYQNNDETATEQDLLAGIQNGSIETPSWLGHGLEDCNGWCLYDERCPHNVWIISEDDEPVLEDDAESADADEDRSWLEFNLDEAESKIEDEAESDLEDEARSWPRSNPYED